MLIVHHSLCGLGEGGLFGIAVPISLWHYLHRVWLLYHLRRDVQYRAALFYKIQCGVCSTDTDKLWRRNVRNTELKISPLQTMHGGFFTWNLERRYWWTYLQGRNGGTDREWTCELRGVEMVGQMERVALTYMHYHLQNRKLGWSCLSGKGAQLGALWWPKRRVGGGFGGKWPMYTHGWLTLLYSRN